MLFQTIGALFSLACALSTPLLCKRTAIASDDIPLLYSFKQDAEFVDNLGEFGAGIAVEGGNVK